jgi:hypothetical protein
MRLVMPPLHSNGLSLQLSLSCFGKQRYRNMKSRLSKIARFSGRGEPRIFQKSILLAVTAPGAK